MNLLLSALLVSIVVNLVMFVFAYKYKTDKLTDISYAATFVLVGAFAFATSERSISQLVLLIAITAWALRLGLFLLGRVRAVGKDSRFDGMRENFLAFLRFWLLQGATVYVVLIASLFFWMQQSESSIKLLQIAGLALFAIGLALEATADAQKRRFSTNPKNKNKWIDSGVWSISRHPNYLGEMMVWSGLYVFAAPALTLTQQIIGLVSPLYIIVLLLFVSGIPILEKSADTKWANDPNYVSYKKRVPVLIPKLFR